VITKRRAAILATIAALMVAGLLLTAFGGEPAPPLVHERVVVLGESGRIIQGHVGDIVDVQLGDVLSSSSGWRFSRTGRSATVTPVFAAVMPPARSPAEGTNGRQAASAGVGGVQAAVMLTGRVLETSRSMIKAVQLLRIAMVAPGVTTVKGWRVSLGVGTQDALPDFFFVILVKS
jgi:hypothetical protein